MSVAVMLICSGKHRQLDSKVEVMNGELLRLVDSLYREKKIKPDFLLGAIENALSSEVTRHLKKKEMVKVTIDRQSGKITVQDNEGIIDTSLWSRIIAQTAKKVIVQKIREAEADVVFSSMSNKLYSLVSGTVIRHEGRDMILFIDQVEMVLERKEQIPGEEYRLGSHIKAIIVSVKKEDGQTRVILSRTHPEFVKKLFEMEVPELAEKLVEIKGISREAGFRTKMAVYSDKPHIDAVGACVGVRGIRIKNVIEELGDEKIDIIKWSDQPELFISSAMKPAELHAIEIDSENRRAKIFVSPDQLALSIGKKGQNIRLASKLTRWEIDVLPSDQMPAEETGKEAKNNPQENKQP
ncbi:MAG: transcription termination factor NusA [Planctomycetota bacterium]|nr:transcription termination factor NusA [Planctomycetota bacterium]MDI6786787.1 transcription termination factor NusA [Planctomycetota bacterium]